MLPMSMIVSRGRNNIFKNDGIRLKKLVRKFDYILNNFCARGS